MALSFFDPTMTDSGEQSNGQAMPAQRVPENDSARRVQELLASLLPAQALKPPDVTRAQKILGSLADGMQAAAAAKLGQPLAEGRFHHQMREQNQNYIQSQMDARNYNRDLVNKVKVGAFQSEDEYRKAMDVAGVRAKAEADSAAVRAGNRRPMKDTVNRDMGNGETHQIVTYRDPSTLQVIPTVDPNTGEMVNEIDRGPIGYAPYIQPAVPGVSEPIRIPRGGKPGPVGGVVPPPSPATAKDAGTAINMRVLYNDALGSYENYVKKSSTAQRAETSIGRKIPGAEEFVLSYQDPEGVSVARKIDNLADTLLRLKSGAQINEQEYARLRTLLPKLGENPVTALSNFKRFNMELTETLKVAYGRAPSMFTDDILRDIGMSRQELGGQSTGDWHKYVEPD